MLELTVILQTIARLKEGKQVGLDGVEMGNGRETKQKEAC